MRVIVITDADNPDCDHIVAVIGTWHKDQMDAAFDHAQGRYPQTETGSLSYEFVEVEPV